MITKEEILKTMKSVRDPEVYTWREAQDVLDKLYVDDSLERIVWYNVIPLSLHDIVHLANVKFRVIICARCEKRIYIGEPEIWDTFQNVVQGDYSTYVIGDRVVNLCIECAEYLDSIGRQFTTSDTHEDTTTNDVVLDTDEETKNILERFESLLGYIQTKIVDVDGMYFGCFPFEWEPRYCVLNVPVSPICTLCWILNGEDPDEWMANSS